MAVRVTTNERLVREAFRRLGDRQARAAIARATQRAGQGARVEAGKEIRGEITLKAGAVRSAITVSRASPSRPVVEVNVSGKGVPLGRYSVRQTKTGVSVQVKRGNARKIIKGAFVATMRSGHRGVWWRQKTASGIAKRLPIEELYTTTVAQALDEAIRIRRVFSTATTRFVRELSREIRFRTARARGRRAA